MMIQRGKINVHLIHNQTAIISYVFNYLQQFLLSILQIYFLMGKYTEKLRHIDLYSKSKT